MPDLQNREAPNILFVGVIACFILSGFAALLYQTAWMRQFSVVFGTSELAIATVLSSYMAGLALGAWIAGRIVNRITRPVLVYGILEALIALSALCVPLLLRGANLIYVLVLGGQPELPDASGFGQSFFYLVVTFIVLVVPTACMGATLPLLTRYAVHSRDQIGPRVGLLYATNTAGAIGGTLVAGFLLLPVLGLYATIGVGASINLVVFLVAATIARIAPMPSQAPPESAQADESPAAGSPAAGSPAAKAQRFAFSIPGRAWILPIMLLSGAISFTYEVLWTRLLSHVLGGSIAAFSTMLAGFLGGIALGAAIASRIARDRDRSFAGFVIAQVGIAVCSLLIYQNLYVLLPEKAGLSGNVFMAILVLLPATLFIGATFPFAVRLLSDDARHAAQSSARVYSWNTTGAIVGATVAGFFLVPLLKYEGAIRMAVTLNIALAFLTCLLLRPRTLLPLAATGAATLATLFLYNPAWPEQILRVSPINDQRGGEVRFYDVGRTATVLVLERDGFLYTRTNGLSEASTNLRGAPPSRHSQRMLTTLPLLARPDAEDMLVIGLGGGVNSALESVPPSVKNIDVLELEPKVVDANRSVGADRYVDPLKDPRVEIVINDARSALQLTERTWDVIVSQPSHPWTAGASHLYTREFMELVQGRLSEDGVFLQWMNSQFIDEALLKSLARTLLEVFPYVRMYHWDPQVLFFLASDAPLEVEKEIAATGRPLADHPSVYLRNGIGSVEDVLVGLAMDEEGIREFARGGEVITDNFNIMATRSAMAMNNGTALKFRDIHKIIQQSTPLLQADSWIFDDPPGELNFAYMGERLDSLNAVDFLAELSVLLQRRGDPWGLLMKSRFDRRQGQIDQARAEVLTVLKNAPDNEQARYLFLKDYARELATDAAPALVRAEYTKTAGSDRAVLDAWHLALSGDSARARELEEELAKAGTTDMWYLDAIKLRVDWRNKQPDDDSRGRYGREAIELIDDAIALYQDLDFYGMRVAAAFLAGDPNAVLETMRGMIGWMEQELRFAEREQLPYPVRRVQRNMALINTLGKVAAQLNQEFDVPEDKLEELGRQVERLVESYRAMLEQDPPPG